MKTEITSFSSSFFEYLCGFVWFDQDKLQALMKRYPIGATEQYEPIFWHINAENKITNGHIITMDDKTGKIFDDDWYYQDGRPMCLFGENLLHAFPSQTVALVTDEMTAAIMSCFPTPYIWLAIEKDNVTSSDLLPLKGRSVVVFPNKGECNKWEECLRQIPNLNVHVSDVMENSQGDCHNIAQMVLSQQPLRPTEEEAALMRMEDANPNIALLVKALNLEVVGVSSIDEDAMKPISKSEVKTEPPPQIEDDEAMKSFPLAQEKRWHGRNLECHKCSRSHERINGTYCDELHQYVEYGKGNCGR
ncbi:DUF6371 domain-containing protein [Bacteroides pyogenes]|uniref:DUF6371 domain-containing protein n=1 Tax=Bacteroides pyogenes TaxID=310300 RepID=UPI002FD8AB99